MPQHRALVIGVAATRPTLVRALRDLGCRVLEQDAPTPTGALLLQEPDLVVLAAPTLPSALDWCRSWRRLEGAPVVVAVPTRLESTELLWLAAGASDVVELAASPRLLAARLALCLPALPARPEVLRVGRLGLEPDTGRLTWDARATFLSRQQALLLTPLVRHPRIVHRRESLKAAAWEGDCSDRALECTLVRLRSKVRAVGGPGIVQPVRDVGYRLGL